MAGDTGKGVRKEGSTVLHRQAESLKTPLALSLFPGVDVGVHWRRDAGLRPGLMKTWWVGRRKQHRQEYDGRVYRNSCQGRQSMTLQTLAALDISPVTSPRVDLGHILSMGGLWVGPG